ncbi:MAG: glutathione S-transferase C-terminal domain-containing protein [Spirochaetaceae bacterium]|jgi:putative glutathione S-transferase|nr:glutathione S-transferase C-terminal domain-containing protein [Spirochaetaceae bacterium]
MAQGERLKPEINADGSFVRQKNRFTTPFGTNEKNRFWNNTGGGEDPGGFLPVEAGRYRLVWARVCPWANRQTIVLSLLGLDRVLDGKPIISIGTVDPIRPDVGSWAFTLDPGGVDPVLGIHLLDEAYQKAESAASMAAGYNKNAEKAPLRCTVPAVIDITTGMVVNNDYHRLSNYWETVWKPFHKPDAPDLYPETLRVQIDALNEIIFQDVNNGVYRAGFARSQTAYEEAYTGVFKRLDELEQRLSKSRFLFGEKITDSDVRLYVTLARFDCAYYDAFRCNKRRIRDYPALWRYARELYAIPAFGENTDFDHIKRHYHLCCDPGNVYKITPKGPDEEIWRKAV